MYWLPPGEAIGKGDDDRWHALFADQPVKPLRQVLAKADPIRMGQAAAREPDKIDKQRQSLPDMPSRDVNIDDTGCRIAEHVARESLALNRDAGERTHRPEEPAHASYPYRGCR
jgi:hypothetical protein